MTLRYTPYDRLGKDLAYSQIKVSSGTNWDAPNITTFIEMSSWSLVAQNDPTIVERVGDRIEVKETGAYLLSFQISVDSVDTQQEVYFALFKDSTEISATRVENTIDALSNIDTYAHASVAELTAGQQISLRGADNKDGWRISGSAQLTVTRLRGTKGETGQTGSGSTVIVENSGTPISNTPHSELSYGPELLATDAGAGQANITLQTVPITKGGTGQVTKTPAFDALAPTTTKGDVIVHNGTDNIRIGVGTNGQILEADSAQASGVKWATPASLKVPIVIDFPQDSSKVDTFSIVGNRFIFPGSSVIGTPTTVKIIGVVDSGQTGEVKLYDVTNALTIATGTFTNTTQAIIDLGTVSNIPASAALFEWQLRRSAGSGNNFAFTTGGVIY